MYRAGEFQELLKQIRFLCQVALHQILLHAGHQLIFKTHSSFITLLPGLGHCQWHVAVTHVPFLTCQIPVKTVRH
jgi:hypothetical protein